MKILPDENIPVQFKKFLSGNYEWLTVRDMQWHGVKNGQLLKL
jgi:predicted nuclease of predicted toxin-antitoxin system